MKYVIGIDPDSAGVPCSVYENGRLIKLETLSLIDLYQKVSTLLYLKHAVEFHIENVKGNRCSSFNWKPTDNKKVRAKKSEGVGMCKQAQTEVEKVAKALGVKVVHHKVSKIWKCAKTGKPQFEKVTGWEGRSNEDTRSAAYFGWLGVNSEKYVLS